MKRISRLLISNLFATLILAVLPNQSALAAPITKCIDAAGKVTYTDTQCPTKEKTQSVSGPPTLTKSQARDAQIRYYKEQSAFERSKANDIRKAIERDKHIAAAEAHEKDCALKKIESDRQRADANQHPLDTWWRNRAIATEREYQVLCSN
jgi:hypothetical protein